MSSAPPPVALRVQTLPDGEVGVDALHAARSLTFAAFGDRFDEHDWQHSCGGWRILATGDGQLVAHAAVVLRTLYVGEARTPLPVGYLEAVATAPGRWGEGLGSAVVRAAAGVIHAHFALGALSTSQHTFYERLGWRRWRGPSFVLPADGADPARTADEDAGLMVLLTDATADLDLSEPLMCEERPGDDW